MSIKLLAHMLFGITNGGSMAALPRSLDARGWTWSEAVARRAAPGESDFPGVPKRPGLRSASAATAEACWIDTQPGCHEQPATRDLAGGTARRCDSR